jgi:hypothetical protein
MALQSPNEGSPAGRQPAAPPERWAKWLGLHPVGLSLLLPILAAGPAWLHENGALASLLVLSAFALVHPMLCVVRPPWWAHTIVGTVAFGFAFVATSVSPSVEAWREGATLFLLPVTLYPAAVALSGAVRCVVWLRSRR